MISVQLSNTTFVPSVRKEGRESETVAYLSATSTIVAEGDKAKTRSESALAPESALEQSRSGHGTAKTPQNHNEA
jgi:hypothetical protein